MIAENHASVKPEVPGGDTYPLGDCTLPDDIEPRGFVVVCLNRYGVAEAFGPYGEQEANDVADFACHLVPTWVFDLDDMQQRYGQQDAQCALPQHYTERPIWQRVWPEVKHATDVAL